MRKNQQPTQKVLLFRGRDGRTYRIPYEGERPSVEDVELELSRQDPEYSTRILQSAASSGYFPKIKKYTIKTKNFKDELANAGILAPSGIVNIEYDGEEPSDEEARAELRRRIAENKKARVTPISGTALGNQSQVVKSGFGDINYGTTIPPIVDTPGGSYLTPPVETNRRAYGTAERDEIAHILAQPPSIQAQRPEPVRGTAPMFIEGPEMKQTAGELVETVFDTLPENLGAGVYGAGGAAVGTAVGGPVGGLIGAIGGGLLGGVTGEATQADFHRTFGGMGIPGMPVLPTYEEQKRREAAIRQRNPVGSLIAESIPSFIFAKPTLTSRAGLAGSIAEGVVGGGIEAIQQATTGERIEPAKIAASGLLNFLQGGERTSTWGRIAQPHVDVVPGGDNPPIRFMGTPLGVRPDRLPQTFTEIERTLGITPDQPIALPTSDNVSPGQLHPAASSPSVKRFPVSDRLVAVTTAQRLNAEHPQQQSIPREVNGRWFVETEFEPGGAMSTPPIVNPGAITTGSTAPILQSAATSKILPLAHAGAGIETVPPISGPVVTPAETAPINRFRDSQVSQQEVGGVVTPSPSVTENVNESVQPTLSQQEETTPVVTTKGNQRFRTKYSSRAEAFSVAEEMNQKNNAVEANVKFEDGAWYVRYNAYEPPGGWSTKPEDLQPAATTEPTAISEGEPISPYAIEQEQDNAPQEQERSIGNERQEAQSTAPGTEPTLPQTATGEAQTAFAKAGPGSYEVVGGNNPNTGKPYRWSIYKTDTNISDKWVAANLDNPEQSGEYYPTLKSARAAVEEWVERNSNTGQQQTPDLQPSATSVEQTTHPNETVSQTNARADAAVEASIDDITEGLGSGRYSLRQGLSEFSREMNSIADETWDNLQRRWDREGHGMAQMRLDAPFLIMRDFGEMVVFGAAKIAAGVTNFAAWSLEVTAKFPNLTEDTLRLLWAQSTDKYNRDYAPQIGPSAPTPEPPQVADFLPKYNSDNLPYITEADLRADILRNAEALAASGLVQSARGGYDVKPIIETQAEAKALVTALGGPVGWSELKQYTNIPLDTLVTALGMMRNEVLNKARRLEAEARAETDPHKKDLKEVEAIQAVTLGLCMTRDVLTAKTELARAVRILGSTTKSLYLNTPLGQAYDMYLGGGVIESPKGAVEIARNTPAPDTTNGIQSVVPEDQIPAKRKSKRKAKEKTEELQPTASKRNPPVRNVRDQYAEPDRRRMSYLERQLEKSPDLKQSIEDNRKALREAWNRGIAKASTGIDVSSAIVGVSVEVAKPLVALAKDYIKLGIRTFGEFNAKLKTDEPEIHSALNFQQVEQIWVAAGPPAFITPTDRRKLPGSLPDQLQPVASPTTTNIATYGLNPMDVPPVTFGRKKPNIPEPPAKWTRQELAIFDAEIDNATNNLNISENSIVSKDPTNPVAFLNVPVPSVPSTTLTHTTEPLTAPKFYTGPEIVNIQERLIAEYVPPTNKKRKDDTHKHGHDKVADMLGKLGGYIYQEGTKDFASWAIKMNAAVGQKIHELDMVHAYDSIQEVARKKINYVRDVQKDAIKRAKSLADVEGANKALDEILQVPKDDPDRAEKYSEILHRYASKDPKYNWLDYLLASRALLTSGDVSGLYRQGFGFTLNPFYAKKSIPAVAKMFVAYNSGWLTKWLPKIGLEGPGYDYAETIVRSFGEHELSPYMDRFKLAMTELGGHSTDILLREEAVANSLFDTLGEAGYFDKTRGDRAGIKAVPNIAKSAFTNPVGLIKDTTNAPFVWAARNSVIPAERAYAVYLNLARVAMFESWFNHLRNMKYDPEIDPEVFQSATDWINDTTGRSRYPLMRINGSTIDVEDSSTLLGLTLFSGRFQISRLRTLPMVPILAMGRIPPGARLRILAEHLAALSGGAMLMGTVWLMAKALGWEPEDIEFDPRSSDFMKVVVGDTRIDVWAGYIPWSVYLAKMALSGKKRESGYIQDLENPRYGQATKLDETAKLVRSKLSPYTGEPLTALLGTDVFGKSKYRGPEWTDWAEDIGFNFIPMPAREYIEAFKQGEYDVAAINLLQGLGIGVQTYRKESLKK